MGLQESAATLTPFLKMSPARRYARRYPSSCTSKEHRSRNACSIVSIRRWAAPRCDASACASVVLPLPGSPANMYSVGLSNALDHHVACLVSLTAAAQARTSMFIERIQPNQAAAGACQADPLPIQRITLCREGTRRAWSRDRHTSTGTATAAPSIPANASQTSGV